MSEERLNRRQDDPHRHSLGRGRDESLGNGAIHRGLLVLGRASAGRLHASRGEEGSGFRRRRGQGAGQGVDRRVSGGRRRQRRDRSDDRGGQEARRTARFLLRRSRDLLSGVWDLVQEILGRSRPVPYERCVLGSTGKPPEPSSRRRNASECRSSWPSQPPVRSTTSFSPRSTAGAAAGWFLANRSRCADAFIAELDAGTKKHLSPHLPMELSARAAREHDFCRSRTPGSRDP